MNEEKFGNYLRTLYRKNKERRMPLRAMMELTYACNHRCVHCYNPSPRDKQELATAEVKGILDQLVDLGTLQISFTGGEIFTRSDCMDIVLYARTKGLKVVLMTNGSLITDEMADTLISWGVSRFEISFLGASRETFDGITRVPGSFEMVISVVKMLRGKGVIPMIKTCVIDMNIEEVEKIARLAQTLDVSFSYSPLVIPRLDCDCSPGQLRISPDQFLDIRTRFRHLAPSPQKKRIKRPPRRTEPRPGFWERESVFNCMVGRTGIFINPYGEVKPCLTLPEPSFDLRTMRVGEAWSKVKEFVDTLKPPEDWECYTCEYQDWCSWCPGRGYLNTKNIFGCPPYFKELAKVRKKRFEERKAKRGSGGTAPAEK